MGETNLYDKWIDATHLLALRHIEQENIKNDLEEHHLPKYKVNIKPALGPFCIGIIISLTIFMIEFLLNKIYSKSSKLNKQKLLRKSNKIVGYSSCHLVSRQFSSHILELRQFGSTTIRRYGYSAIRQIGATTIRRYHNLALPQFGSMTIRRYEDLSLPHLCVTTIRRTSYQRRLLLKQFSPRFIYI